MGSVDVRMKWKERALEVLQRHKSHPKETKERRSNTLLEWEGWSLTFQKAVTFSSGQRPTLSRFLPGKFDRPPKISVVQYELGHVSRMGARSTFLPCRWSSTTLTCIRGATARYHQMTSELQSLKIVRANTIFTTRLIEFGLTKNTRAYLIRTMYPRRGPPKATPTSVLCQKCLQRDTLPSFSSTISCVTPR